jgi:FkbM family methyltransferase
MRAPKVRQLIEKVYARAPLKRRVFEVMRRTVRLPRGLTGYLRFRGPFTVKVDRCHYFRLEHCCYLVETDLFWNGFGNGYEGTALQIWRRLAEHAQVVFDVGANTGIYTLVASCVNPTATIVALEPVERVFHRLQRNIELNGRNVILKQLAASDTTGVAVIYDLTSDHEYTASLDRSMLQNRGDVIEYSIATKRLDDILFDAGLESIDLIKIDVELFEPQVLVGMGEFLSRCKPTVLIEILTEKIAGQVTEITKDLGYNIFRVVEQRGLERASQICASEQDRNYLLAQDSIVETANILDFVVGRDAQLKSKTGLKSP